MIEEATAGPAASKASHCAAKSGGFHFRFTDDAWRDTRNGTEFFAALSDYATQQAGEPVRFEA